MSRDPSLVFIRFTNFEGETGVELEDPSVETCESWVWTRVVPDPTDTGSEDDGLDPSGWEVTILS